MKFLDENDQKLDFDELVQLIIAKDVQEHIDALESLIYAINNESTQQNKTRLESVPTEPKSRYVENITDPKQSTYNNVPTLDSNEPFDISKLNLT